MSWNHELFGFRLLSTRSLPPDCASRSISKALCCEMAAPTSPVYWFLMRQLTSSRTIGFIA